MAVNLSEVEVITDGLFETAAELTVGITGTQEQENEVDGGLNISQEDEDVDDRLADKSEKCTRLPLSRIKTIMKLDPDLTMASQEAVVLVAKATELFIEYLAKESFSFTSQNKKKTLQKKDIESSIDIVDAMVFLEGTLE